MEGPTKIADSGANYLLRNFVADDYKSLSDLFSKIWNIDSPVDFWKWKYAQGGFGWVIENQQGKIVSYTGFWSRKTILGGKTIYPVMIVDMMTDPDFRGKVYGFIMRKVRTIPSTQILFGFTNPVSHRIYEGVFRRTLRINTTLPNYGIVFNPNVLIPLPSAFSKVCSSIARALYSLFLRRQRRNRSITIAPTNTVGKEFDVFWQNLTKEYVWLQDRGSDYISWRFIHAQSQSYILLKATEESKLVGYIVVSAMETKKGKKGLIGDWLVSRSRTDIFASLVHAALDWCVRQNVDMVEVWTMNHEHAWIKVLRKFLFIKLWEKTMLCSFEDSILEAKNLAEHDFFFTMADSDYGVFQNNHKGAL
jgi:hypothetical protein